MKKKVLVLSALAVLSLVGCTARGYTSSNPADSTGRESTKQDDSSTSTGSGNNYGGQVFDDLDNVQIRVAYGVDSENIIRAEIQVADNKVVKARFDEVKFHSDYTGAIKSDVTQGENVISGEVNNWGKKSMAHRAKYITVDGKVWTGSYADGKFTYKDGDDSFNDYYSSFTKDEDALLANQDKLASLYYSLVNNYVYASDKDGKKDESIAINTYSKASYDTNYWVVGNESKKQIEGSQWKWNVYKIEDALKGKNLADTATIQKLTRKDSQGKSSFTWVVNGVDTGATLTAGEIYVKLAQLAFMGKTHASVSYSPDMSSDTVGGNKACIAKVELVCDKDNKVKKAFLNETVEFLGYYAMVPDGESVSYPTVDYKFKGYGTVQGKVAKYLSVDGTIFTANPYTDETVAQFDPASWSASGINDAYEYYTSNVSRSADFYNAVFEHQVRISSDANGEETFPAILKYTTATKAEYGNTYWSGKAEDPKTLDGSHWKWNIQKVEKSFEGIDFKTLNPSFGQNADGNKDWNFNDTATGATLVEYPSWVRIALLAGSYLLK